MTLAGIGFAVLSMLGVALVLGAVALVAATFGRGMLAFSQTATIVSRGVVVITGLALVIAAAMTLAA